MNLDDLEAYLHFAECLNFTKASESLSISQPALHVKIKRLGRDLGTTLYTKQGRKLSLTESGKQFVLYARTTLEAHHVFRQTLSGEKAVARLSLAAGAGCFLYLLGPAIRQFSQDFSGDLKLITAGREPALELLRLGEAELAVTVLNRIPKDMEGQMLASIPAKVVVPNQHALAGRKSLRIDDVAGYSLIVPPEGRPFRETLESCFSLIGAQLKVGLIAEGWELMMHFASLGLGPTVVNGCCRVPKGCRAIPLKGLPPTRYFVLRLGSQELSRPAQRLEEAIIKGSVPNL